MRNSVSGGGACEQGGSWRPARAGDVELAGRRNRGGAMLDLVSPRSGTGPARSRGSATPSVAMRGHSQLGGGEVRCRLSSRTRGGRAPARGPAHRERVLQNRASGTARAGPGPVLRANGLALISAPTGAAHHSAQFEQRNRALESARRFGRSCATDRSSRSTSSSLPASTTPSARSATAEGRGVNQTLGNASTTSRVLATLALSGGRSKRGKQRQRRPPSSCRTKGGGLPRLRHRGGRT